MWLVDPVTKEPLPAFTAWTPPKGSLAGHLRVERDPETNIPVRTWFAFCEDPGCCPPFERPER